MVISRTSYFAKPVLATETVYPVAGTKGGALKTPAPLLSRTRLMPNVSLLTVTVAPGTAAPVASRTAPLIPPVPACEKAFIANRLNTPISKRIRFMYMTFRGFYRATQNAPVHWDRAPRGDAAPTIDITRVTSDLAGASAAGAQVSWNTTT